MKTKLPIVRRKDQGREGSAVLIVLILLTIVVVFTATNTVTVNTLRTQVKLVEQQQIHRLAGSLTNQPPSK